MTTEAVPAATPRNKRVHPVDQVPPVGKMVALGAQHVVAFYAGAVLVPLLIGHNITGFMTMLCTLVIYQSAYLCEIIRGGIQALPSGQYEASRALGLGYVRTTLWVILPQALYNALPSLISQFISIIKETSLGYVINVQEVTFAANQVNNQLLTKPFQVFFILAIIYYLLCFGLTRLAGYVEQRIARKRLGDGGQTLPGQPLLATDN